jgi:hypothetical protein
MYQAYAAPPQVIVVQAAAPQPQPMYVMQQPMYVPQPVYMPPPPAYYYPRRYWPY